VTDGYRGASMSQIPAQVGGSKGTFYSYFSSK
jgi:AcrR family transcriptional regulator